MEDQNSKDETVSSKSKLYSYTVRLIKFSLAVIVIYFAGRKILSNWNEISGYDWKIRPVLLILSIFCHQIALVIYSKMWCYVLESFGHDIPLKYAFRISNLSNLGRYIPGKIWSAMGAIYLLKPFGINKEMAFASWILTTIFILPPAFLLGLSALLIYPETISYIGGFGSGTIVILVFVICLSVFLMFYPDRAIKILNKFITKLKRPALNFTFGKKTAIKIFAGYLIGWIIYGIAFFIFLNSIMLNPGIPITVAIGSFILAYVIGYLAFFSPGGLGIREIVLIAILSPYIGPLAAGIAGFARIWNIISEIISALIALLIKPYDNPNEIKKK